MQKPSIAELLSAWGYATYTPELIQRAMSTLYGHVGANLDGRNWAAILQSANPLEAAEAALLAMYQNSAYLVSNIEHLAQKGYVPAQAELTSAVPSVSRGAFMSLTACTRDTCSGLAAVLAGRVVVQTSSGLLHVGWLGWLAAATSILSIWLIRRVRIVADKIPPANQSAVPLGVAAEG